MADFAPSPWSYQLVGKDPASGRNHLYLLDANGRKIGVVWGRSGEKEATAATMMAAPELLAALIMVRDADNDAKLDGGPGIPAPARWKIDAAIALAEGRP